MWRVQGIDPTITQVLGAYVSAVASLAVADVLVLELNCAACLRNALLVLVVTPPIGKKWCGLVIFAPYAVSLWGVLLYSKAIFASIFMRGCLLQGKNLDNLAVVLFLR